MTITDVLTLASERANAFRVDEITAIAQGEPEVAKLARARAGALEELVRTVEERMREEVGRGK